MSVKTGLFIDSFEVLHKGHDLCIKYALGRVDNLVTIIYDNDMTNIPLTVRANWLRKLYPEIEVIEAWFDMENKEGISDTQRAVLNSSLKSREVAEVYSTREELEGLYKALNLKNSIRGEIRKRVQQMTTKIQCDNYGNRLRIDDRVYRDLITNVAFVGAQSTGKSTIAEAMAKKYNTNFMFEYGRYHWDVYQKDRIETLEQIEEITERHIEMEEKRLKTANKYLFTDTCPIVTLRYAYDWHGRATDKLLEMAKTAESRYDIFFLCGDEIPYADTPERDGIEQRRAFQRQIEAELLTRKIPYIPLSGTLQERMNKVSRVLDSYQKYTSLGKNIGNNEEREKKGIIER